MLILRSARSPLPVSGVRFLTNSSRELRSQLEEEKRGFTQGALTQRMAVNCRVVRRVSILLLLKKRETLGREGGGTGHFTDRPNGEGAHMADVAEGEDEADYGDDKDE